MQIRAQHVIIMVIVHAPDRQLHFHAAQVSERQVRQKFDFQAEVLIFHDLQQNGKRNVQDSRQKAGQRFAVQFVTGKDVA